MMKKYGYDPEALGSVIKRLIKQSEFRTQEEFAKKMNVELRTVSRWVNGQIDSLTILYDVCSTLNVNVSDVILMSENIEKH